MNKMYNYLEEHSYISKNKHSNYQFELTKERAECIANKYNSLIKNIQQENKQLKENWNKLKEYIISTRYEYGDLDQDLEDYDLTIEDVLNKMLELEQGSVNNE